MTVVTAAELRRRHRRMDRRAAGKWRVLAAMREGACLHRYHVWGRTLWSLSTNNMNISAEMAADVIADPHVVPVGDALDTWGPSQTYRWTDLAP
jgi:hypothetical protein